MSDDLTSVLTRLGSEADPGMLPTAERVRARGDQRTRHTVLTALACVVVVVVGLVGTVWLAAGTDGRPEPVVPPSSGTTRSTTPSVTPTPASSPAVVSPTPVETQVPGKGTHPVRLRAVVYANGRFVTVGDSSTGDRGVPVWWSQDGLHWHRPAPGVAPTGLNLWDVAGSSRGFVAIAPRGLHASVAWYSPDGSTWQQTSVPAGFHVYEVTATGSGWFAWGDGHVYRSGDGRAFHAFRSEPSWTGDGNLKPCWVDVVDGRVVAGGATEMDTWVLTSGAWAKRDLLVPPIGATPWCYRHDATVESATGPTGTVVVQPYSAFADMIAFQP